MKWIKELRVTHYLKNCLIFLPVFFDGKLFIGASWGRLAIGFVAFCLGASAIYLINDIKDLEKDRKHPTKCKRPIAAGEISVSQAIVAAVLLIAAAYLVQILLLNGAMQLYACLILSAYILVNLGYSVLGMKNIPLLDIALLVAGFYLRVYMGAFLSDVSISSWLYLVIITGACYLGFGKRRNELIHTGSSTRKALALYTEEFLNKTMYSCMTMTLIFFSLWCMEMREISSGFMVLVPIMMLICFKYNLDIEQKENDGDPMSVILKDKILMGLGMLLVLITLILLYLG